MRVVIAIVVTFVLTALVAAGVIGALLSGGKLKNEEPAVVTIQQPERGDLTEFVSARAEAQSKTRVSISARVAARISELPCEEGDPVTKGDPNADPPVPPAVLVRLDAAALEAALASTEANRAASAAQIDVEKAQIAGQQATIEGMAARLAQGRVDLERQQKLLDSHDVSQSAVDSLQCQADELDAQLRAAQHSMRASELNLVVLGHRLEAADAAIREARDNLTYTTITSPVDGVVTRVYAEEGEMVVPGTMNNPGMVIAEVADLSRMVLKAQVDETDVSRVQVGQKVRARIHAFPDDTFEGIVQSVAPKSDVGQGGSKYYLTEIGLDPGGRHVLPGSTADVDIEVEHYYGVLTVPSQAVVERLVEELPLELRENNPNVDATKTYATVVYRFIDGKAAATPVKIGASDETRTVVVSGLSAEDRVIVGPYKALEGMAHDQTVRDESEAKAEAGEEPAK